MCDLLVCVCITQIVLCCYHSLMSVVIRVILSVVK
jgi:hypothetical protein